VAKTFTKFAPKAAVRGARKLVLHYLKKAEEAAQRLQDPDDAEALHDVRVALRHVRTYLATYRKLFAQAISPATLDALRDIAHLTNPARDAEVQAAWLADQPQVRENPSGGAARLHSRLKERQAGLMRESRERFAHDLHPLATRLRWELDQATNKGQGTFGRATAKQVMRRGKRLRERLDRIEGVADVAGVHKARIAAKRVRYLLEPFKDLGRAHEPAMYLKDLQDILGEMHDLHVLLETMAGEPTSAQPPGQHAEASALAPLATKARERLSSLYSQVDRDWRSPAGARLDKAVIQAASVLRKAGRKKSPAPLTTSEVDRALSHLGAGGGGSPHAEARPQA